MRPPITLFDVKLRKKVGFINAENLATIKRIYDKACVRANILVDDVDARTALAEKLITASATISTTDEYEALLTEVAYKAVAN